MDKSPDRGIASCEILPAELASARLLRLASTAPVQCLLQYLGSHASLHLVGGTVREAFIQGGAEQPDLDIACAYPPEKTHHLLEAQGIRVIDTGIRHGTLTALVQGQSVEITTFRKPGARNQAVYSESIAEDLQGRDFTMNAMAWDLNSNTLLDPHGGYQDLKHQCARAVGTAKERFLEDPLRILRLVRFGPARGFSVDPATAQAAQACLEQLSLVSVERVRVELEKILCSVSPAQALRTMQAWGLLSRILPELDAAVGCVQNRFHTEDVFSHTLSVVQATEPDLILRLTALFHDAGKPATLSVGADGERHFYEHEVLSESLCVQAMQRLKFSNDQIQQVRTLVRLHMRPVECGPAGIRRLMRDLGPLFSKWREFKVADAPPVMPLSEVQARMHHFDSLVTAEKQRIAQGQRQRPAVNGDDLIALGFVPGPLLGRALRQLEELVLEDPACNIRDVLLKKALELKAALTAP